MNFIFKQGGKIGTLLNLHLLWCFLSVVSDFGLCHTQLWKSGPVGFERNLLNLLKLDSDQKTGHQLYCGSHMGHQMKFWSSHKVPNYEVSFGHPSLKLSVRVSEDWQKTVTLVKHQWKYAIKEVLLKSSSPSKQLDVG